MGQVTLDDDSSVFGSATAPVTFRVSPGAVLELARNTALGSGAGVASVIVETGGALQQNTTNAPASAVNGNVRIQAGGRFLAQSAGGLTGSGALTFDPGSILQINTVTGWSGSQALAATVSDQAIVRLNVTAFGTAAEPLLSTYFNGRGIYEMLGNLTPAGPSVAGTSIINLNGGLLTNDLLDRAWGATTNGTIFLTGSGTIAASSGSLLTMSEDLNLAGNTLSIGSSRSYAGNAKLGEVSLSGAVVANAGAQIQVAPGARLRIGAANVLSDNLFVALSPGSAFFVDSADTILRVAGTGVVTGDSLLTLSEPGDFTLESRLTGSTGFGVIKTGAGTMTLTDGGSGGVGTLTAQGGRILFGAGANIGAGYTLTANPTSGTATIDLNGTSQTVTGLNLQGSSTSSAPVITGGGSTLTLAGSVFYLATNNPQGGVISVSVIDLGGADRTFSPNDSTSAAVDLSVTSVIRNGSLTKTGTGILALSGANTYAGSTTIGAGLLRLESLGALGATSGLNFNGGGLLNATGAAYTFSNNSPITFGGNAAFFAAGDTSANNINLGTGAVSLTGSRTFTLNGTGTTLTLGGTASNTTSSAQTQTVNGAGNTLVFGGDYALATGGAAAVTDIFNGTGNITIGGTISDGNGFANGLTYSGTGTLVLGGTNTYTGATTVSAGTLQVNRATGGLGDGTAAVTLGGGTLSLRNDGSGSGGTILFGSASNPLGYAVRLTATTTINVGNLTANTGNVVQLGALTQTTAAARTLNVTGANGYSLSLAGLQLSPLNGNVTTLNPTTASLLINGAVSNPMSGYAAGNFNALVLDGTASGNEITGPISDAAGASLAAGGLTRVTKSNTGTWTLKATNSYLGLTSVTGGTLRSGVVDAISNAAGLGTQVNATGAGVTATLDLNGFDQTLQLGSGGTGNLNTTLQLGGTTTTSQAVVTGLGSTLTLAGTGGSGGDVQFLNTNNPLGAMLTVSTVDLGGATRVFNIADSASANEDLTVTAALRNGGLTKSGAGTLLLSGVNTYTGPTTVSAGTLLLGQANSLYNNTSASWTAANITVANGATLGLRVGGTGEFSASDAVSIYSGLNAASGGFQSGSILALDTTNASGPVVLNTAFSNTNAGANTFGLSKLGLGTLTLSGANTYTGNTTLQSGTLNVTGSILGSTTGGNVLVGTAADRSAVLNIAGDMTFNQLQVGTVANGFGAVNLSAGTVTTKVSSNQDIWVGVGAGSYGAFNITGGTVNTGRLQLGANSGSSTAVALISGGTVTASEFVIIGRLGATMSSLTVAQGGTLLHNGATQNISLGFQGSGRADLNLTGGILSNRGRAVAFGQASWTGTGTTNVNSGTLTTDSFVFTSGTSYLNLNGGTIASSLASASFLPNPASGGVYVNGAFGGFAGGAVFDTGGVNITVAANLLAPTGAGVTTIDVPSASQGSGYIGAPYVSLSGGGGVGAVAIANMVDDGSGNGTLKVGSITVINPGIGYTSSPTVSFVGGGATVAAVAGTVTTAANTSGGLTKNGAGTLTLSGANTFTGPIVVNGGSLVLLGINRGAGQITLNNGSVALGSGGVLSSVSLSGFEGRYFNSTANSGVSLENASDLPLILRNVNGTGLGAIGLTAATQNTDLDFSASGLSLPTMSLAAASGETLTYGGVYTPGQNGVFLLGGMPGGVLTFNQNISDASNTARSSVEIESGGAVTLGGTNTFTGGFSLASGGTLRIGAGNVSSHFGANVVGLVSNGGTIQWATGSAVDISAGTGAISGGLTLSATTSFDTNGNNVTLAGSIGNNGAGGITKTGAGSLTLAGANTFTGATTVSAGTLVLAHSDALAGSTLTAVTNSGATPGIAFDEGVGSKIFTLGGLTGSVGMALQDNVGGAITLRVGNNNTSQTYSGVLSGGGGLTKLGFNTLTLTGKSTYTGATTIQAGPGTGGIIGSTLRLDFSAASATSDLLSASSALVFGGTPPPSGTPSPAQMAAAAVGGGALNLTGKASTTNSQTFNGTTVGLGGAQITMGPNVTANPLALNLGALTRTAGGTLNVTLSGVSNATNGVLTGAGSAGAILTDANGTAYATIGNNDWAFKDATNAWLQAGTYTASTSAATFSGNANVTASFSATSGATVNSIRLNDATARTLTLSGVNTVSTGGILFGSAGATNTTITGGTIRPGAGRELVVFSNATAGYLTSVLADSASGSTDVTYRSNPNLGALKGDIRIGSSNTYTGNTYLSGGRVWIGSFTGSTPFGAGSVYVFGNTNAQYLNQTITLSNPLYLIGNGWAEASGTSGALRLDSGTIAGPVTLMGDAAIGVGATGTGIISGAISGSSTLTKLGLYLVRLQGNNSGFTGRTVISAGAFQYDNALAVGGTSGISLGAAGTAVANYAGGGTALAAKLVAGSSGTLALTSLTANDNIDFSGTASDQVYLGAGPGATLTYGGVYTPRTVNGLATYRLGGGGGTFTYTGNLSGNSALVISGGAGNGSSGIVILTGTNTYRGGTTLSSGSGSSGVLQVPNSANPFSVLGNGGLTFLGNAIIQIQASQAAASADLSSAPNLSSVTLSGGTAQFDTNGVGTLAAPVVFARGIGNYGAGGFQKNGFGFLRLDNTSNYTGSTGVNGGTLLLNTANPFNTGYSTTGTQTGATMRVNDNASFRLQLAADATVGTLISVSGTTTNPASGAFNLDGKTLTVTGTASNSVSGWINGGIGDGVTGATGSGAVVKDGSGTLTFSSDRTAFYTGSTTVNGGTLSLDYSVMGTTPTAMLNASSSLVLGGGVLSVTGKAASTHAQTVAGTTINPGASRITTVQNSATAITLNLGAITRNAGGAVDFTVSGLGTGAMTTTTVNGAGGILGGYATVNGGAGFAAVSAGNIGALGAYSATYAADANVDNGTLNSIGGSALSIHSLRFNAAAPVTLDATGGLTLASGGLLVTPTVAANAVTINNGSLTSGNGADLIVHQHNTNAAGTLTIASRITGNIGLTKSGGGTLVLSNGANDFTGTTHIGGAGVVRVDATGALSGGVVNIISAGRLEVSAGVTLGNALSVSNATAIAGFGAIHATGTGVASLDGAITVNHTTATGGTFGAATGATLRVNGPVNAAPGQVVSARIGNVIFSGGGSYDYFFSQGAQVSLGATNGLATNAVVDLSSNTAASLDLSGFNQTLAGLTRVSAQTATLTNSSATASVLTLNVGASNGGAYTGDYHYRGAISGNLALVKAGAGTQTLSGANSFTGGVTLTGGTLRLGSGTALGSLSGVNSALSLSGGTLDLNGVANVAVGAFSGTGGRITDTGLTPGTTVFSMASAADSSFAGTLEDGLDRSLAFFKDGASTLTLTGNSNYSGVTRVFAGALNIRTGAALGSATGATFVSSGAALELQDSVTTAELLNLRGAGLGGSGGALRSVSGNNTLNGTVSLAGDARIESVLGTLTLGAGFDLGSYALTVGGAGDTVSAGGTGTGSLIKDGAGTLTLNAASLYSGGTTVSGGTLVLGLANALAASGNVTVSGGTLAVGSNAQTVGVLSLVNGAVTGNGVVTGTGFTLQSGTVAASLAGGSAALVKTGSGTVTMTGASSYGGGTSIAMGTLRLGDGVTSGSVTGDILNNGVLEFANATAVTYGGAVSGSGSLTKTGAGVLTLTGASSHGGGTTIQAGTLRLGDGSVAGSVTGNILNNAALEFANPTAQTYAGVVSGSGSLTKTGAGVLTLTGANIYTGGTTIQTGTLRLGDGSVVGSVTGNILNNGALEFANATAQTYAGVVSGSGSLTKTGAGVLTLTGANSYAGGTAVHAGTLTFGVTNALAAQGALTVSGGALDLGGHAQTVGAFSLAGGSVTGNAVLSASSFAVDTGTIGVSLAGAAAALTKTGAGTVTLTGASSYGGGTTIGAGTLALGDGVSNGSVTGDIVNNGALVFANATAQTYTGGISGTGSLSKTALGGLTLTGAHTYTGATEVSLGQLTLSGGSLGGTDVGVGSGVAPTATAGHATLRIAGDVTLGTAAAGSLTVRGGNTGGSPVGRGTLSLVDGALNTLTLANTTVGANSLVLGGAAGQAARLEFELGDQATDRVVGARGLLVGAGGAVVQVSQLAGTSLAADRYALLNFGNASLGGQFTFLNGATLIPAGGGRTFELQTTGGALELVVALIPAPGALYWSGALGNSWSTLDGANQSNWVDAATGTNVGQIPGPASNVFFTALGAANFGNTVLGGDLSINSLNFNAGASGSVGVSGDTLTLNATGANGNVAGSGLVVEAGSGAHTIASRVALGADQTWWNYASNTLTVSGAISGARSLGLTGEFTFSGAAANTFSGGATLYSGGLTLAKTAGVDALAGDLTVNGGTVRWAANHQVKDTAGVSVSGGVLDLGAFEETVGALTVNGGSITGTGSLSAAAFGVQSGTIGVSLAGAGAALTKTGSGQVTLTGANTYGGGTTVTAGTLQLGDGVTGNGSVTGNIVNDAALIFANPSDQTYAGSVTGAGAVTKIGAGTLTLTGASSYGGGTTVSGGTLRLGDGLNNGSVTGNILNNAAVIFANGAAQTYAGVISGTGSLTKDGPGALTFSGAQSYTGNTLVSSGTLVLDGGTLGGTAVTVGGTLKIVGEMALGTASAGGVSVLGGTGHLSLEDAGIHTLTLARSTAGAINLSLGGGVGEAARLSFEVGANTTDQIQVGRRLALNAGGVVISVSQLSGPALDNADYTLISFENGSVLNGGFRFANGSTIIAAGGGRTFTLDTTATALRLIVDAPVVPRGNLFWSGAVDSNWSTLALRKASNWADGINGADARQVPGAESNVYFTTVGAGNFNSTVLGGDVAINSLNFNASAAGSVGISGNTLTLNATGANGNVAGTGLVVEAGSGSHTIWSHVALAADQTWINYSNNALTAAGSIGGPGTLGLMGKFAWSGADANTRTAATTLHQGQLILAKTAGVDALAGDLVVNAGTVQWAASAQIRDTAAVTLNGGELALGGYDETVAALTLSGGTVTGGGTLTAGTFAVQSGTLAANLAGGRLTKTGSGTVVVSGTNTFSEPVRIEAGTLQVAVSDAGAARGALGGAVQTVLLGATSGDAAASLLINGAYTVASPITAQAGGTGTLVLGGAHTAGTARFTGAITLNRDTTLTSAGGLVELSGVLSGAGGVRVTGTGAGPAVVLSGTSANLFSGLTTVESGTLRLGKLAGVDAVGGNVTVKGGRVELLADEQIKKSGVLRVEGGVFDVGTFSETVGGIEITGGSVASSGGRLQLSGGVDAREGVLDVGIGGAVPLTKTSSGVTELRGNDANTFTGLTSVSAGTLLLNKSAGVDAIAGNGGADPKAADVEVRGGTLQLGANEQINDTVNLVMNAGAFSLNGKSETIFEFTNRGGRFSTGQGGRLVVTSLNTTTWAGGANTINTGGLLSTPHLVVSGGVNTVEAGGTLQVGNGNLAGGSLDISSGAQLVLQSGGTTPGTLNLSDDVRVTNGGGILTQGGGNLAGRVDLGNATRTVTVTGAEPFLVSASVVSGGLRKLGEGTLILSGTNTYSGGTRVEAGGLLLGGPEALGRGGVELRSGSLGMTGGLFRVRIVGDYAQKSGARLTLRVGAEADGLQIGGRAELGGSLVLERAEGFRLRRGDRFELIRAEGGVSGSFDQVEKRSLETGTLLETRLVTGPEAVVLEAKLGSFAEYAKRTGLGFNHRSTAAALDRVQADVREDRLMQSLSEVPL